MAAIHDDRYSRSAGHGRSRPRSRSVYLLPNLFTTAVLFSGFYAIVAATDGNFDRAGIAVFIAMLCDGLDGRIARWTNTQSDFGKEYDSLSDMVAFGAGTGDRRLPVGRRAHRRVRLALGPARLARDVLLCRMRGAAPRALQCARRTADKRYFEGSAESVGCRAARRLRLDARPTCNARACGH